MKKKQYIALLILTTALCTVGFSQPIVNERYEIDGTTNSIFGSVISTDSCYYVAGVHTSSIYPSDRKGTFIRFNFDGSISHLSSVENDTMGIDLKQGYNLTKTLDNNFAYLAVASGENSPSTFLFIKIDPMGDTILTKYYGEFYNTDLSVGRSSSTLIQNTDSSYFGLVHFQRETDGLGGVTFFKLDKFGNLLYWSNYYGSSITDYSNLRSASLVRVADNELIIGVSLRDLHGIDPENYKFHTKFFKIDTLGNVLAEHVYWDDTLSLDCNSLTKTSDGGLLYCGRNGRYFPENGSNRYRSRVVKLNADWTVDWQLDLGRFLGESGIGLYKIMQVSETEYVVVGNDTEETRFAGALYKFNLDGQLIWQRKYLKIPPFGINPATHNLYDIDRTTDSGFVMVGESTNYYITEDLPGQKAWLLKVDKYGCLVPGCQLNDNPVDTTDTTDTTVVDPPDPPDTTENDPITWLYPNPTSKSLFYYHHQAHFNGGTAYIYNSAGQMVQKWEITENDITYEVDVSQLASGTYTLKVFNMLGEALETERFVKN